MNSNKRSLSFTLKATLRPVYLGVVVFCLLKWAYPVDWPKSDGASLLGAALTVASVVIGFLISAQAIILSAPTRAAQQLKEMGLTIELTDAFALAVYISMGYCILNTYGYFIQPAQGYCAAWIAFGFSMLYSFKRICSVLFILVKGA